MGRNDFVTNDFLHYNINNTQASIKNYYLIGNGKQFKLETEMLTNGLQ